MKDTACADKVNFLAMGNSWNYYNYLGLAPKSETTGPVFIQALYKQKVISEQSATLHYNPHLSTMPSTLTLGPIQDKKSMIAGD